jgi:hypothetical protein
MSSQPQNTKPDPHLVLKTLLYHNQSPTLHETLTQKAEKMLSPTEAEELLNLFCKMGMNIGYATALAEDEEKFHCARCHKTYLERDNAGAVCCIEHEVFNDYPERWGGDIFHYTCKSCGRVGIEEGGGNGADWPDGGICYEGQHTCDPDDVDYDGDNTLTCESFGCPGHEELHCVRCHERYVQLVYNGEGCCIEHEHDIFDRSPERVGDTYRYTCDSCGKYGIKDKEGKEMEWADSVCFEGKHTVNAGDVKYDGVDTLTCASRGCVRGSGQA